MPSFSRRRRSRSRRRSRRGGQGMCIKAGKGFKNAEGGQESEAKCKSLGGDEWIADEDDDDDPFAAERMGFGLNQGFGGRRRRRRRKSRRKSRKKSRKSRRKRKRSRRRRRRR